MSIFHLCDQAFLFLFFPFYFNACVQVCVGVGLWSWRRAGGRAEGCPIFIFDETKVESCLHEYTDININIYL